MRRIKLFFLLTALLAIAQGTWAQSYPSQTFNSVNQGNNTISPVTVNCAAVSSSMPVLSSGNNITISISAGYTIVDVALVVEQASSSKTITATNGTLTESTPSQGDVTTVQNVNNSSTTLSTSGNYRFEWMTVYYTPVNYTITYNLGGGSVSGNPTSYNIETATFTLKNPTRSGYTFTGWTGSNGSTKQTSVSIAKGSTGNKNYTANWQANTYSVSYNANGGTGAPSSQTKTHGTNLTLRDKGSLSRTGYTTDGWATSAGGNKAYNFGGTYSNNAAITLYAHWNANTYKVKFNGNGNTGGSMSDQNFTYGTAQNLTANGFSKTGYTFAGWATSADGAKAYNDKQNVNNLTTTNGGTFNLYAVWSVVNYTISYTLNGGTATNPTNYNIETATFTLNNPTRDGYTFTGWTGSNGSTPQTEVSIAQGSTGDKNYTANWICQAAVDVMNLINAIGTPITLDSKDAIDAARAAYNALTDAQKTEVTNYATLTAAETAYNTLVTDHAAADAVIAQINAIGSPITATSQTAIEDARAAYDALTDDQKALVGNLSTLTDAEVALAVVNLINAIGSPITAASQSAIDAAHNAYDALSNDQKALVGNLSALTDAEAALAVVNQIAAIGEVTLSSGSTIADVRTAYNALTDDQQALVGNYATLTDAEAALAAVNLINAIDDPVVYTNECHQEILDARAAYDALSDEQKALVDATTLQKLTDAEADYDALVADHAAADAVVVLFDALPVADAVTLNDKEAIEAARAAYDALTDEQKALVSAEDLAKLTDAEQALAAVEKAAADQEAANAVVALFDALPADITLEDKATIEAARAAYDALTDDQKALVTPEDLAKLTDAEQALAAVEKAAADQEAADAVVALFDALPAADAVTLDDKTAIEAARAAYDALTDEQKALVSAEDLAKLTDAEAALAAAEKAAADQEAANAVVVLFDALPVADAVTLNDKEAIEAARAAYDALTDEQKALVSAEDLAKLTAAEQALVALEEATGIEDIQGDIKSTKLIKDGQILILRGEKTYTLQGAEVK